MKTFSGQARTGLGSHKIRPLWFNFIFFISCSLFVNLLCLIPESVLHQPCVLALFGFLFDNMHWLVSDSRLSGFQTLHLGINLFSSSFSLSINTTVVVGQAPGASQRSSKEGCVHYSCNTKLIVYVSDEYFKTPAGHLMHTDFSLCCSTPVCVFHTVG